MNGVINFNTSQEIIKVKVVVIVVKLLPSYYTYAKILAFDPYVANTSFTYITIVAPYVSIVSNNPIVTL